MIGKFEALIVDYGVSESKAGRPQVYATFEFTHKNESGTESTKQLTWYGSLYEKAIPVTLRQLLHCGLREGHFDKLDKLADGPESGLLDTVRPRIIDIQEEPHFEDPSKTRTRIAWVNDPEIGPTVKKIGEAANRQFFGENRGLFADRLAEEAKKLGIKTPPAQENDTKASQETMDDIPF